MRNRFVIFSVILFGLIFILSKSTYDNKVALMDENNLDIQNSLHQEKLLNVYNNWQNTWDDITLTEGALHSKEIEQINLLLTPVLESDEFYQVNPLSCFFTSYYSEPDELNLDNFLWYFPYSEVDNELEEALDELKEHSNWPFGDIDNIDELPVPIHRYNGELIRTFLKTYMYFDESTFTKLDEAIYLESTDAYYNYTSDFGPGTFICVDGNVSDHVVVLESKSAILTVVNIDDKYFIKSYESK